MAPQTPNKCHNCKKTFAQPSGLNKHKRNGCSVANSPMKDAVLPDHLVLIKGDVHFSSYILPILQAIEGKYHRFLTAQSMGIFVKGLYPLVFRFQRAKVFRELEHFSSDADSTALLLEILREKPEEPFYLKKSLTLHTTERSYDLSPYTCPNIESSGCGSIQVVDSKDFYKVIFKTDSQSPFLEYKVSTMAVSSPSPKGAITQARIPLTSPSKETFEARKKQVMRDLMDDDEFRDDDNHHQDHRQENLDPNRNRERQPRNNGDGDDGEENDDEGSGNESGGDDRDEEGDHDGDDSDTDSTDTDDDGGGGGGEPDPSDGEGSSSSDDDGLDAMMEDLTLAEQQELICLYRESSLQTYAGFDDFNKPAMRRKRARQLLSVSSSSVQQFLSPFHFPEIMTNEEMRYITGCTKDTFRELAHLIDNDDGVIRVRTFTDQTRLLLYLEKLRSGMAFDRLGMERRLQDKACRNVFWNIAVRHYLTDTAIPHRNYEIEGLQIPTADQILNEHIVTDPYIKAIFQPSLTPDHELVIFSYDHTYIYTPRSGVAKTRRSTYSKPKKENLVKFGTLCDYKGKAVSYTPMSSGNVPDSGDGNLLMIQSSNEVEQRIVPRLDPLLRPQGGNKDVYTMFDKGYLINKGNRRNNLTLDRYYTDPNVPGHDPRHKYFSVIDEGDPILDENFNRIPNPHPVDENNPRSTFTCAEANTIRITTMFRYTIEVCFTGIKQFKFFDQRKTNFNFLEPMGRLFPEELKSVPKLEVLYNNVLALYNRVHPGFARTFPLPDGYTPESLAAHFHIRFRRSFNPFDPVEGIRFSKQLLRFPTPNQRLGYRKVSINDFVDHEFPILALHNMTLVTLGSYQIKNHRMYITDIQNQKISDWLSTLSEEEVQLNHNDYDVLMSGLPDDHEVFVHDELREPENWPERFGPWIPQRWIVSKVPSAHCKKVFHNVLISYVPPSFVENEEDIENPLGFELTGYRRIIGYACFSKRCKIGMRNLGCCSHVCAILIYLGVYIRNNDAFKNLYRKVHKLDIRNVASLNRELFGNVYPNQDEQ